MRYDGCMDTNVHTLIPCGDRGVNGSTCVEAWGHERNGLSHLAADGTEWLAHDILGTYHSSGLPEMAQAS